MRRWIDQYKKKVEYYPRETQSADVGAKADPRAAEARWSSRSDDFPALAAERAVAQASRAYLFQAAHTAQRHIAVTSGGRPFHRH